MSGGFLTGESQADFDKWIKSRSGSAATQSFEQPMKDTKHAKKIAAPMLQLM
jgi:hypothetical protein